MTKRFADLAATLRSLSDVPSQSARGASAILAQQIQDDFDAGLDPYGSEWAPLAGATLANGRTPPPLTDTGAMRGTVTVAPMGGSGISVTIDDPAIHHQYGTMYMPSRPMYPNKADLPDTWKRAIADAAEESFERILGGASE